MSKNYFPTATREKQFAEARNDFAAVPGDLYDTGKAGYNLTQSVATISGTVVATGGLGVAIPAAAPAVQAICTVGSLVASGSTATGFGMVANGAAAIATFAIANPLALPALGVVGGVSALAYKGTFRDAADQFSDTLKGSYSAVKHITTGATKGAIGVIVAAREEKLGASLIDYKTVSRDIGDEDIGEFYCLIPNDSELEVTDELFSTSSDADDWEDITDQTPGNNDINVLVSKGFKAVRIIDDYTGDPEIELYKEYETAYLEHYASKATDIAGDINSTIVDYVISGA